MGRFLAIDYGTKRTGLAVSDPLKIIATALETVETTSLLKYLTDYFKKEQVLVLSRRRRLPQQQAHKPLSLWAMLPMVNTVKSLVSLQVRPTAMP